MTSEPVDILLVEDNDDDAELFRCALKDAGFMGSVRIAHDGVEALDFIFGVGNAAEGAPIMQPRLIVVDLKLPRVNGMEIVHRLKANVSMRCVPIVVLSSSREKRDLSAAYQLGANSYVVKPMDFNEFTALIQALIRYWLQYNQALKS